MWIWISLNGTTEKLMNPRQRLRHWSEEDEFIKYKVKASTLHAWLESDQSNYPSCMTTRLGKNMRRLKTSGRWRCASLKAHHLGIMLDFVCLLSQNHQTKWDPLALRARIQKPEHKHPPFCLSSSNNMPEVINMQPGTHPASVHASHSLRCSTTKWKLLCV